MKRAFRNRRSHSHHAHGAPATAEPRFDCKCSCHRIDGKGGTQAVADNDDLVSGSMDRFRNNSLGELVEPRLECGSPSIDVIKRQNPIVESLINSPTPAWPFEQENEQDKACNRTQRTINEWRAAQIMREIQRRRPRQNTQEDRFDQRHDGEEKISLVCYCITQQSPGPDQVSIDLQRLKQSNDARTFRICVYEIVPGEKLNVQFSAPIRPFSRHAPVGIGCRTFQRGCGGFNGPCFLENRKLPDKAQVLVADRYGIVSGDVKNLPAPPGRARIWRISGQEQLSFWFERNSEPAAFRALQTTRV